MPVISTVVTSPSQAIDRSVVFVVLKITKYSVVPLTSNALHYHKPHGTTNMSIPSLSVIPLKMTPMNIIVIFAKKNEIPKNGSTIVKIVVILLIPNVFLRKNQIAAMEKVKRKRQKSLFIKTHSPSLIMETIFGVMLANKAAMAYSTDVRFATLDSMFNVV
ncbi:hypothetical protein CFP56_029733 [Quercus suber]|uniref:Uncharacterized protein n=1 Tax=Quercus suber TaxID=58331 RepID=A0AAW0LXG3_QUESU